MPDGHGRVELTKFHTPVAADTGSTAPEGIILGLSEKLD
jgi:hypothetical protein